MSSRKPDADVALATSDVVIETPEGAMGTYVSHPGEDGPHPTVVFLMDAPGKRPLLHRMADVIASHGYFVLLPNLYYRTTDAFELDFSSEASLREMTTLMRGVGNRMVARDVHALLAHASDQPEADGDRVGIVGYCMSGPFSLYCAAEHPDRVRCAASFYGVRLVTDADDSPAGRLSDIDGEIYVAAAEFDDYVSLDMVRSFEDAVTATGTRGRVEVYWGTHHGFAFDDRPAYDAAADERHWTELLSLFERNLGAPDKPGSVSA